MRVRWVMESGEVSRGCASDFPFLISLMKDGDLDFHPDVVELQFSYADGVFFVVWRRGLGTITDEIPERFADELNSYFRRRERFRARKPIAEWSSIKTNWIYNDRHHMLEYVPVFEGLVEVLQTLCAVPRLVRFEVGYGGMDFLPIWDRGDGFRWDGLSPQYLQEWSEYCKRNGLCLAFN